MVTRSASLQPLLLLLALSLPPLLVGCSSTPDTDANLSFVEPGEEGAATLVLGETAGQREGTPGQTATCRRIHLSAIPLPCRARDSPVLLGAFARETLIS